jgi:hypothetical protein
LIAGDVASEDSWEGQGHITAEGLLLI